MQEQKRKSERAKPATQSESSAQKNEDAQATNDMLDEIDEVLEVNAETFIRDYVQKGGQVLVWVAAFMALGGSDSLRIL